MNVDQGLVAGRHVGVFHRAAGGQQVDRIITENPSDRSMSSAWFDDSLWSSAAYWPDPSWKSVCSVFCRQDHPPEFPPGAGDF